LEPQNFADLFALLDANGVEFLIVGGYAVAFHGAPRFTADLDLFVRPDEGNVERLLATIAQFGFPVKGITVRSALRYRTIFELGKQPVQAHIMTHISGVTWEQAWASRKKGDYGGQPVFYIGRKALLSNKTATGRAKDLADVEALRRRGRS
jgi:hypothetical protein